MKKFFKYDLGFKIAENDNETSYIKKYLGKGKAVIARLLGMEPKSIPSDVKNVQDEKIADTANWVTIAIEKAKTTVKYDTYSSFAYKVSFVDDNGEFRIPVENKKEVEFGKPFTANGKKYISIANLKARKDNDNSHVYRDIYGRKIIYLYERFPCFDSFDAINEDRFYNWFFILDKDKITRIYYADGIKKIHITEDVQYIEGQRFDEMKKLGCFKEVLEDY